MSNTAEPSATAASGDAHSLASPQKIYVELTRRCNLHCRMCVKYASGSSIGEEEMSLSVFKKLLSLARAKTLILNGIGEPLLHPQLDQILHFARKTMPAEALIGFQSNGLLLNGKKCCNLLSANDNSHQANDCYGSNVPCGHCQWNLGGFRCL